jgi:hypothetical protein
MFGSHSCFVDNKNFRFFGEVNPYELFQIIDVQAVRNFEILFSGTGFCLILDGGYCY